MAENDKDIHGRDVRVIVRNDQFNPSQAVAVCKELVEEKHVFMLTGMPSQSSNGDQMEACARYAASVGVPYVSLGSNERRVRSLDNYFAATMTFDDQGPLLADYLLDGRNARRSANAIVSFNTPLYTEAHQAVVEAMEDRGAPLDYVRRISHTSGTSEARTIVQEMQLLDVENVVIMTSPVFMLNVLNQANSADFHPLWIGPGLTITANDAIPNATCGERRGSPRSLLLGRPGVRRPGPLRPRIRQGGNGRLSKLGAGRWAHVAGVGDVEGAALDVARCGARSEPPQVHPARGNHEADQDRHPAEHPIHRTPSSRKPSDARVEDGLCRPGVGHGQGSSFETSAS